MNIDIQEVAPCRKQISVDFSTEEVNAGFDKGFADVTSVAQLPGFRKGHVPRKMLERKFGDSVREQVRDELFQKGIVEALKKEELSPLGGPDKEPSEFKLSRGEEFKFAIEIDVRPKFELGEYKGLKLVEKVKSVDDSEVEGRIETLRLRFADHVEFDGPAQEGHIIEGKAILKCGEEEIFNQENRALKIEGTTVFGIEAGNLKDHLAGITPGETRTINFKVPEDFYREDLRGKDAEATITPDKIMEEKLPELDDAFASRLGLETFEDLKKRIREAIESENKNAARQALDEELSRNLVEANSFDIPEGLLKRQTEANIQRRQMQLLYSGMGMDEAEKRKDEIKAESEKDAEFQIRRMVIFDAIAEKEKIEVSESEIQMHIVRMAQSNNTTPQKIMQTIQKRNGWSEVQHEIMDVKTTQLLLDAADIETVELVDTEAND